MSSSAVLTGSAVAVAGLRPETLGLEFTAVPAGIYPVGDKDTGSLDPQMVTLERPLQVGRTAVANAVFAACQQIGYPECAINLAHGVAYLAGCAKNRSAYDALRSAQADVSQHGNLPIPLNLRNAPTKLMKSLGYGKDYEQYTDADLLPEKLKGKKYLK